jgi:hypothetical protein
MNFLHSSAWTQLSGMISRFLSARRFRLKTFCPIGDMLRPGCEAGSHTYIIAVSEYEYVICLLGGPWAGWQSWVLVPVVALWSH